MQNENIYEKVKDKFVLGENISQTASFVVSGSADVGMVALALALSPNMKGKGRYAEVPSDEYPPIEQACVIGQDICDRRSVEELRFRCTRRIGQIVF
jgi:molybdate transport system substrate-binding protein